MSRIRKMKLALVVIGMLLVVPLLLSPHVTVTRSGELDGDLQGLLEELKARLQQEEGFTVTFQFAAPLTPGETEWVLGGQGAAGRRIGTVGADYVCFGQRWNDGTRWYCTPFSNVVAINYLEP